MRISDVISLFAALIGSTATLFGAWVYIRSQRFLKGELLRAVLVITVIMASIFGLAVFISRTSTIKINGQDSVPVPPLVPGFSTPANPFPSPTSFLSPTTPSPTLPLSPTSSLSPTPSPSPISSPSPAASPSPSVLPSPTLLPSPTPTKAK